MRGSSRGKTHPLALLAVMAASLLAATSISPTQAAAKLELDPSTARPNQAITVTGSGFTQGSGVTVSTVTLDGGAVSSGKFNFGSTVEVDSGGAFVATLLVPVTSATLSPGGHTVKVTDSSGTQASAKLTVPKPTISVSPKSARGGAEVTVTGAKFPVNTTRAYADSVPSVSITYEADGSSPRHVAAATPDANGAFSVTFDVPRSVPSDSTNKVRATVTGASSSVTAEHEVPDETVTVTPAKGSPGTTATVKGSNFTSFVPVSALSLGSMDISSGDPIVTDGNGSFTHSFTVPLLDNGAHQVSITVEGKAHITAFTIEGAVIPTPVVPPPHPASEAGLGPLGENLVRTWHFNNGSKGWAFYDPDPAFAGTNTLTKLQDGEVYWVELEEDQTVRLNGEERELFSGWNVIAW